jgi:acetyl esterase
VSRRARARKLAGAAVVDSFFRGASRLGKLLPDANPERHGVEVLRDLPYVDGAHRLQHLDIYRPLDPPEALRDAHGRLPIVLYVHGGGFRMLSKDSHWLPALIYARRGYVVFNISYRLAPEHPFPAALDDTIAALEFVARHAERFGGDLQRLALAGESAGANLVTSAAVCLHWRRSEPYARRAWDLGVLPKAVLPAMGLLQVSEPERFRRKKRLPALLHDRIDEVTEAYLPDRLPHDLADPLLPLERRGRPDRALPAFHACCGTADPLIDDTRRLQRALSVRGVPHTVSYWPGGIHAFHMFVFRSQARELWREMLTFTHTHVAGVDAPIEPIQIGRRLS